MSSSLEMNTPNLTPTTKSNKTIQGDGDGIKPITPIRIPVPSCRKFTPTSKSTKDMKSKLEIALKEMKKPNKNQTSRSRGRVECASVDTPVRITNRKRLKYVDQKDIIKFYGSPEDFRDTAKYSEGAARLVLRCLLLNSWRQCRWRYSELKSVVSLQEENINQLNMQIDVLQNLRKSESIRREEISIKYREMQKEFDDHIQQNLALRNHVESLEKEKSCILAELGGVNERTLYYKQEIEEKSNIITAYTEKLLKEKEKLKKSTTEKKLLQEQNQKLENIINIQKENLENLKSCVESLQHSEFSLKIKLENSEKACKYHSEQIRILSLDNATNKSKITAYEKEREELQDHLNSLQQELAIALNNCESFQKANDDVNMELLEMTRKFEEDRQLLWNWMRKGAKTTYCVIKYLADKIVPALQVNFTC